MITEWHPLCSLSREQFGDTGRLTAVVLHTCTAHCLFPQQVGLLSIPVLQLDAQVDAGSFWRDFFGRSLQQVRRKSEALQIQVTEPPADLGSRHWLPARRLTLQDDWQQHPPTLRVGEPATRTLTLTAEGREVSLNPKLGTYDVRVTDGEGDLVATFHGMVYRKKDTLDSLLTS